MWASLFALGSISKWIVAFRWSTYVLVALSFARLPRHSKLSQAKTHGWAAGPHLDPELHRSVRMHPGLDYIPLLLAMRWHHWPAPHYHWFNSSTATSPWTPAAPRRPPGTLAWASKSLIQLLPFTSCSSSARRPNSHLWCSIHCFCYFLNSTASLMTTATETGLTLNFESVGNLKRPLTYENDPEHLKQASDSWDETNVRSWTSGSIRYFNLMVCYYFLSCYYLLHCSFIISSLIILINIHF